MFGLFIVHWDWHEFTELVAVSESEDVLKNEYEKTSKRYPLKESVVPDVNCYIIKPVEHIKP